MRARRESRRQRPHSSRPVCRALYAALLATDAPGAFLAAEAVVVVEALVLTRLWRVPVQSAWLWVTAVLVNGLSTLAGAALMSVSR
ncbi:MAG TPA: hypothetical protein P5181_09625 [Dermatophilaceae bacterium]|nr:hypothetical protein [Dermatophilaceae bacterium]